MKNGRDTSTINSNNGRDTSTINSNNDKKNNKARKYNNINSNTSNIITIKNSIASGTATAIAAFTPATKSSVSDATSTWAKSPQPQEIPAPLKPNSDQDSYKETLTSKKRNVVIFGDTIPKAIKTRSLNTNLIRTKAISKWFKVLHQRCNKQHYECKT